MSFTYLNNTILRHVILDSEFGQVNAYSIEMSNGTRARFWYGSDGQRYKRQDQDGKITLYLGNVEIIKQGNAQTIKRMVAGVQQQTIIGNTITTRYFFHDRLGSIAKITNAEGNPEASQDYKAYGGRRDYNNPNAAGTPTNLTDRGYTGHEHLDGLDVIHMNGRIYDPVLQRFLQPDPVVQAPGNLQSWNAYTYVFNNPLVYTDPTGMMSFKSFVRLVVSVVISYYTGIWAHALWSGTNYAAALAVVAGGGYASGYVQTGSGKGGLANAYSSLMFFGVGRLGTHFQWSKTGQVAAHALAGGVLADVQGGNFGHGFYTAGLNKAVMANVPMTNNEFANTALMALAGGTISAATGGKFANGALTAAIQLSLNQTTQRIAARKSWTVAGVKRILERSEVGRKFLQELKESGVKITKFLGARDTIYNADGTIETKDMSDSLAGSYDPDSSTISVYASLSNHDAAQTLYHEYQHHLGADEIEARIRTEQFAIDAGMRPTSPGYRTPSNTVNIDLIHSQFSPSGIFNDHYNFGRHRRRYYSGVRDVSL